jgi:peptidoglycan hydrolase CwlO-like protein
MIKFIVYGTWFMALLVVFLFFPPTTNHQPTTTYGQSADELTKQLEEKQDELRKVEKQLEDTKKQEKTLNSQLEIIDTQTKVTLLKIEETTLKIEKLEREINDLSGRIDRISTSVDKLSEVLLQRIVKTYKYSSVSNMELIFSSQNFSELIERVKYVQVAQVNDKKVLYQLQATKTAYNEQKQDKETRQTEAEVLGEELEKYNDQLTSQKKAKEELLIATKNDEQRYQKLIEQLRADAASITRAISNVGLKIGPVSKGQVIGVEGLTGCTSGPHLHFEVFENAKVEGGRVNGNRVSPRSYIDTGKLGPPMQGYPDSTHVSTEYGEVYALGTHTGLDIYDNASVGTPILAADSGTAYAISDGGCRIAGFDHGAAKGLVIDHGNGIVTLYWHLL